MNKRLIALLLSACFVISDGVLVYAKAPINSTESVAETGNLTGDYYDDGTGDYNAYEESAYYNMPYYYVDDFAIGVGQARQLAVPEFLTYTYYDVNTFQWGNEYIQPVVTFTSQNPAVVAVGADGVVYGQAAGTTSILIEYSYYRNENCLGNGYTYVTVDVTDVSLSTDSVMINIHGCEKSDDGTYYNYNYVTLEGLSQYSEVEYKSSSKNLVVYKGWDDFYFYPKKKGNYTVTFTVDGKVIDCHINVVNMWFSRDKKSVTDMDEKKWRQNSTMIAMYKGETTTLKANGIPAGTKIKWTSSNKKVATVSSKGLVKAKGNGYATITAECQGYMLTYEVGVSNKRSIAAIRYAVRNYHSTYSQPKRMSKGYYDCSSYVWRAYKDAGFDIGNGRYYAPVAADLAKWCKKKGYVIYSGNNVKVENLLPGDIIFWTGADNGRYKGIYHVDLYVGNYRSLTVAREKWFGDRISHCMVARIK